jgi:hypothetical protein
MKTAGYVLLVIGLILTIYTGITFFTKEKVLDVGPVEVTKTEPHTASWSPLIGIAVMAIGGILVWQGNKR